MLIYCIVQRELHCDHKMRVVDPLFSFIIVKITPFPEAYSIK